jgi:hypothetical protein
MTCCAPTERQVNNVGLNTKIKMNYVKCHLEYPTTFNASATCFGPMQAIIKEFSVVELEISKA